MVIQSQSIAMQSKHSYRKSQSIIMEKKGMNVSKPPMFQLPISTEKTKETANVKEDFRDTMNRIRMESLNYILQLFFSKHGATVEGQQNQPMGGFRLTSMERYDIYEEEEAMEFSTQGKVVTADGREIQFDVNVGMSRNFYQEVYQQEFGLEPVMCDPLVINLDTGVTQISDQKFFFDLDCDGQEDEISLLGQGSAFLALDKNEDGIINDGSELFGTTSGNGFYDLSKYDLDGNGWIDEADEIFDRLKIWMPDADGKGACYKLKDMGVGAICLQNISTEFSVNGENNVKNAQIRSSGVFLFESGRAGTIQHVDMAM